MCAKFITLMYSSCNQTLAALETFEADYIIPATLTLKNALGYGSKTFSALWATIVVSFN